VQKQEYLIIKLATLLVRGIDYRAKYKSNYHMITVVHLCRVRVMRFNITFNNILAISWRSVLLAQETADLLLSTDKHYNIILS